MDRCNTCNQELQSADPVYYKIWKDGKKLSVVCLQSFDEHDYDQDKFLSQTKYENEEDAENVIAGIKIWLAEETLGL